MADLETIRKRLEKHILSTNHTFREISLKIGRKDSYIQQYVKYGFPKRLNEVDRKKICQILNLDEKELVDDELIKSGIRPIPVLENENFRISTEDFVNIDILTPKTAKPLAENIIGRMTLNFREFNALLGANPYNLRLFRMGSDAMEPAFPAGTLILYDSSVTSYAGDGIYIINLNGTADIKRLQKTSPDTYTLKTDNPHYQDLYCKETEIEIIGRATNCLFTHPL